MRALALAADDQTKPKTCDECAEWSQVRRYGWDADRRCRPQCYLQSFGTFAHRALAVWRHVASGELVDADKGTVNWTVDWAAFLAGIRVKHPLFDPPADGTYAGRHEYLAELWEAMPVIRGALMQPTGEWLLAQAEADG